VSSLVRANQTPYNIRGICLIRGSLFFDWCRCVAISAWMFLRMSALEHARGGCFAN
jgi:hypothetical protein